MPPEPEMGRQIDSCVSACCLWLSEFVRSAVFHSGVLLSDAENRRGTTAQEASCYAVRRKCLKGDGKSIPQQVTAVRELVIALQFDVIVERK